VTESVGLGTGVDASYLADSPYYYDVDVVGFLTVTQTAASDITVVHSAPTTAFG
jgi:hypothetical protein